MHTSNFHPCRPPGGHPIRKYFEDIARAEGFSPTAEQINSVAPDIQQFCREAKPRAIDYYIVHIHDIFGIPRNGSGNALAQVEPYPFFSPGISIPLFFYPLERTSVPLSSDNIAIKVWGGGDKRYGRPERQERILAPWRDFQRNWSSSGENSEFHR